VTSALPTASRRNSRLPTCATCRFMGSAGDPPSETARVAQATGLSRRATRPTKQRAPAGRGATVFRLFRKSSVTGA
jgi:hypothetical protein